MQHVDTYKGTCVYIYIYTACRYTYKYIYLQHVDTYIDTCIYKM